MLYASRHALESDTRVALLTIQQRELVRGQQDALAMHAGTRAAAQRRGRRAERHL